jgi:hypothetical protein
MAILEELLLLAAMAVIQYLVVLPLQVAAEAAKVIMEMVYLVARVVEDSFMALVAQA